MVVRGAADVPLVVVVLRVRPRECKGAATHRRPRETSLIHGGGCIGDCSNKRASR